MRGRITIAALAVALLAVAAGARAELIQSGGLRLSFQGGFTPKALPRDRAVPVTVDVQGSISTIDGTRPPVLREMTIELNRNGRLNLAGLPTCNSAALQSTTTEAAMARCRPALVGRGDFGARIDFQGLNPIPTGGRVLAFNGFHRGRPALLLQLFLAVPVRAGFVVPLAISHRPQGRFGTVLSARIPTLAGGSATVTDVSLRIGRTFTREGRRRGFISAACAAPAGFSAAVFPFARGRFEFVDGRTLSTSLTRDCRVR